MSKQTKSVKIFDGDDNKQYVLYDDFRECLEVVMGRNNNAKNYIRKCQHSGLLFSNIIYQTLLEILEEGKEVSWFE